MIPRARSAPGLYNRVLRNTVTDESRAYGFSVVILTTGYLATSEHGLPGVSGAFSYMGAVVAAQWLASVIAFGKPSSTWRREEHVTYYAHVAVHFVSVVLAVLVGWGLSAAVGVVDGAFAAAGFGAVLTYQLLLAAELMLGIARLDDRDGENV